MRTKQLQQPEEPVGIVFERRGAQKQHVPTERRDGSDGAPPGVARVPGRAAKALRLVDHQQVDARAHGLFGQLRPLASASPARRPRGDARRRG